MANSLKWLGHSAWQLTTSKGKVLLFDPWLNGNPMAPFQVNGLPKADYVLLTHDHFDHAGDVPEVLRHTGATLVAQFDVAMHLKEQGVPESQLMPGGGMNIGGSVKLGDITVTMVDAYHSSTHGSPTGFIVTLEDGKVVYNAGDTGLHVNMSTWGELFKIDVAILPIGDHFTMDGRQAARALRLLGNPPHALPQHYRTFPLLAQNADDFIRYAKEESPETEIHVLEPGQEYAF